MQQKTAHLLVFLRILLGWNSPRRADSLRLLDEADKAVLIENQIYGETEDEEAALAPYTVINDLKAADSEDLNDPLVSILNKLLLGGNTGTSHGVDIRARKENEEALDPSCIPPFFYTEGLLKRRKPSP